LIKFRKNAQTKIKKKLGKEWTAENISMSVCVHCSSQAAAGLTKRWDRRRVNNSLNWTQVYGPVVY